MRKTAIILTAALMISGPIFASESKTYEVTITNLTKGQIFTPVLAATHKSDIAFFELGAPAIEQLELLAEDGATDPLNDLLMSVPELVQDTSGTGPIMPGATASFMIEGSNRFNRGKTMIVHLIKHCCQHKKTSRAKSWPRWAQ